MTPVPTALRELVRCHFPTGEPPGLPTPPPPQELAILLDMALKGELPRLRSRVVELGREQAGYQGFVTMVVRLIDQYDEEGLLVLLERYTE